MISRQECGIDGRIRVIKNEIKSNFHANPLPRRATADAAGLSAPGTARGSARLHLSDKQTAARSGANRFRMRQRSPGTGTGNIHVMDWTPDLSTGVPSIDDQHKQLFLWLAELQSATADQRTLFGVYVITRLKHYIREHFAAEEALMRAAAFPGLDQHIAEHTTFRTRLEELQLRSIGEDISEDTVRFLTEWLTHHITGTDMAYVPYLKKQQARSEN